MTHKRRAEGKFSTTISFSADMHLRVKKDDFLSNVHNKERFIHLLTSCLIHSGCHVFQASGDADLLIVQKAVESSENLCTVVVGDDTDLLVLLCYHGRLDSHDLFLKPEPKASSTKNRVWNIKEVKVSLGLDVCNNILTLHAFLGCDTTSRLHGIGKGASLKKYRSNTSFRQQIQVFNSENPTHDEIASAGENVLVTLYGGKPNESLNQIRYQNFCEKITTGKTHVEPHNLPPTQSAAKYHSFRVYLQICQWKGINLQPSNWGWVNTSDRGLIPLQSDLPPAPEQLLLLIRCNCQTDCSSQKCSCRKHGIECSVSCGNCRGSGCTNSIKLVSDELEEESF